MGPRALGLAGKLALGLGFGLLLSFGGLGFVHLRSQRGHMEAGLVSTANRISDVIQRSAHDLMLRNDVEGLYRLIRTFGSEPGLVKIRIFNEEGRISYSTDSTEVGHTVDKAAEACFGCHADGQARALLPDHARYRHLRSSRGPRVLALINPIHNEPACWNAACHAHPSSQQVLGVLDTQLSLEDVDSHLAAMLKSAGYWLVSTLVVVLLLSVGFLEWFVFRPVQRLLAGVRRVARGELDSEIDVRSRDELGVLADAMNRMMREVRDARQELTSWNRTLERRVKQKTVELERAHEHVLQAERMASIGKLAAIVAHEINNPLAGIRTYALLLKRRIEKAREAGSPSTAGDDAPQVLDLVASEAARLGDIVRNLLQFSRPARLTVAPHDLSEVVDRAVRLVKHQVELQSVALNVSIHPELPPIECDGQQIQQALVALLMNSLEATGEHGEVEVSCVPDGTTSVGWVEVRVRDNGMGMDKDTMTHAFEPFFTTKETSSGTGLGLAVVYGIVSRHRGEVLLDSAPGRGTTVTMRFPTVQPADAAGVDATQDGGPSSGDPKLEEQCHPAMK